MITYAITAILVLGVLIIVHEFGHFWVARKMGVGVEKFSIGFGKSIWKKKVGETEYIVAWVPFGGYVKMVGDEEVMDSDDKDREKPIDPDLAFNLKPLWRRSLIVAAGPIANLLFAVLLFSFVYMIGMPMPDTKIKTVMENSPAASAGLLEGDRIVEIDGTPVETWGDLAETISEAAGKPIRLMVEREDGLIDEIKATKESKVPLMGDIPFIGHAFKNTREYTNKRELIILLRPRIVRQLASNK